MEANLLYRRNPLAYPASTVPGVNPSHRAAQGLRFSGVASGGGFISLTQGRKGTIAGTPSFGIDRSIGPGFIPLAGADAASFSGQSTTNDTSMTMAGIVRFNAVATGQVIFSSSSVNSGWRIYVSGGTVNYAAGAVVANGSTVTLVANTPYFVIVSVNGSGSNFLALNLATGKFQTATGASAVPVAPNGSYIVGNDTFNEFMNGNLAAVMFSASFMTITDMQQWAADPWAFWYPRRSEMLKAAAAAAFLAAWANQSNLPVLGTGTY